MMRREELLAREAWSIEDATVQHAIELWEHGDRISRMSPLTSQARQNSGTRLSFDGMAKGRSSPRNDPRKEIKNGVTQCLPSVAAFSRTLD